MSSREQLKHDIDTMPPDVFLTVKQFVDVIKRHSIPPEEEEARIEEGYRLLEKNRKKILPPIDDEEEKQGYFDEKYGRID
jgi:hypothetical protein